MKTFLTYISDVYTKMCEAMKKNGIITGVLIALVIVIIYSVLINPINVNKIIDNAFAKEKQEKIDENEKAMERRIAADAAISPILEQIIEKYKLGRAIIFEKHNSVSSVSGVDFLFFSATIEVLNATEYDMDFIADDFQRQSVSNQFGALVNNLKYKDYIYIDNVKDCNHPNHQLVRRFGKLGANSLLFVPIKNDKNRPVVIIVFTSKHDTMPYLDIINELKPNLKLIKQLLVG